MGHIRPRSVTTTAERQRERAGTPDSATWASDITAFRALESVYGGGLRVRDAEYSPIWTTEWDHNSLFDDPQGEDGEA